MKNVNWLLTLAFVFLAFAVGCGQAPQSAPPASTPSAAPTGGDDIGIPECDDYLSKVESCIANHVPEEARAMQQQSMEQMRSQWRQAAGNETAKATLAAGCKAALEAARASFATYGCEF